MVRTRTKHLQDPFVQERIASAFANGLLTIAFIVPMCALVALFFMETIWSPGPHLQSHVRDQAAPEHTDRDWNVRVSVSVFPTDRQGFLDHIERRAQSRGGNTLARDHDSIAVVTDLADARATLQMARLSENSKLGEHYIPWTRVPSDQPPANGTAATVLVAYANMPFTAHPATEPMLVGTGIAAGLAFITFLFLCTSGIPFRI